MRPDVDYSHEDGTVRAFVSVDEGEHLSVKLTDEGVIFDAQDNEEVIATVAMTYEEWYRFVQGRLDTTTHLTESQGLRLLHRLMDQFGWAGTVMTRSDVDSMAGRYLTDEEWLRVQTTHAWDDAASAWNESGVTWESVAEALREAGLEPVDDDEDDA